MTDYPRALELEPIKDWPGELTASRGPSAFESTLASTMRMLAGELDKIDGTNPRLQIAVVPGQLRLDGRLRAGAKPWHPGIILSFDTPRGEMRFASDQFVRWEENLRAIAKTLEALRAIARWGATRGEQYGGFLAIEAATAMPAAFTSAEAARDFIYELIRAAGWTTIPGDIATQLRQAKRLTHPDMGGDPENFQRVTLAEQYLNQNGAI